ncbi:MAG: hypothetical protein ACYCX6_12095 [Vulcanimicrobiaceae bacterium]
MKNPIDTARRRYVLELTAGMLAYAAILIASIHALNAGVPAPWRSAVTLAPVVPVAAVFIAIVRFFGGIDELQRKIHLEALAVAAGVTALLAVTYGFLEGVGFPKLTAFATYACIMLCWGLAAPFVARRYK